MKRSFLIWTLCLCSFLGSFAQNGFNLQSQTRSTVKTFIPENSRIKVRVENGSEVSGRLTGADSNSIYITKSNGKQVTLNVGSIKKITVFHDHDYFNLTGSMLDGVGACGSGNCDTFTVAVVVVAVVVIVVGELIVDATVDASNDEHYDLKSNWRYLGPVVAK